MYTLGHYLQLYYATIIRLDATFGTRHVPICRSIAVPAVNLPPSRSYRRSHHSSHTRYYRLLYVVFWSSTPIKYVRTYFD
jgi:hypothetical protein